MPRPRKPGNAATRVIPSVAHFIWFGSELPWAYALAMMSVARCGDVDRVCLHHADTPTDGPGWRAAVDEPRVELVPLDPRARLQAVGAIGGRLVELYDKLEAPASRANMVRAAILYTEGGIYLDTDTITIAPLTPLRRDPIFVGLEHIVLPYTVRQSRRPLPWVRAGVLLALREGMRRLPRGHRLFRHVAPLYHAAANNAVLGAAPKHPFMGALLQAMVDTPPERQTVRFALGTNLLQARIDTPGPGRDDLVCHPPEVFYPLGPEVSEHWFRLRDRADLEEVLAPSTRVIHWYASVRTKAIVPQIDPAYVERHAATQLFSAAAVRGLRG